MTAMLVHAANGAAQKTKVSREDFEKKNLFCLTRFSVTDPRCGRSCGTPTKG